MKIIALSARSDRGKTPTLRLVYQKLKDLNYQSTAFKDLGNNDIFDVLELNGIKIGFVTQGDYPQGPHSLHNYLKDLENRRCILSICACRSKGGTKDSVIQYPDHYIIGKTIIGGTESEKLIVNEADANRILDLTLSLI